jgi:hypothetical protein
MLSDITEYDASGTVSSIPAFFEKPTPEDLIKQHKETSHDMVIPEPSYLKNIGKSARVNLNRYYDAEETEHYQKMQNFTCDTSFLTFFNNHCPLLQQQSWRLVHLMPA